MKKEKDVYWNYFCLEIIWKDFVPIYLVFLRAINNIENVLPMYPYSKNFAS